MKPLRRMRSLVPVVVAAFLPVPALAADADAGGLQYTVSAGLMRSDNAGQSSTAPESETSYQAGLNASMEYERERYEAVLDADMQFQKRSYGSYGTGLLGGLAALARYRMFRDRVVWMAEENLGKALIDARNTVTPDNTQDINIFSTGPDFVIPLGIRTSVNVQGRWTLVSFEESDFGNRRLSGSIGIVRRAGATGTLSLTGTSDSVSYKDLPSFADYDIRTAALAWTTLGSRTRLNLSVGYGVVKEPLGSTDGTTVRVEVDRRISANSTVSLHGGRAFGDAGDAVKRDRGIRGVSVGDDPAAASSDPQKADYATLIWNKETPRGGLTLSGDWRHENHLRDANLNRRSLSAGLVLRRRVSPRMDLSFHADYGTTEFPGVGIEYDERGAGVGMNWRFTRTVAVSAGWDRLAARGDTGLGEDTRDFNENRFTVNLNWTPVR